MLDVELPAVVEMRPDFVSFLVGVNDVVQGVSEATYRENLGSLVRELLRLVPTHRLLAVSTPDYTVTPAGADYGDPEARSSTIRRFNAVLTEETAARAIALADIHDLSLAAARDRSLVAGDGLHPSGAQYALWVDRIAQVVMRLLAFPRGEAANEPHEQQQADHRG